MNGSTFFKIILSQILIVLDFFAPLFYVYLLIVIKMFTNKITTKKQIKKVINEGTVYFKVLNTALEC